VSSKILLCCFALDHCHSSFTALAGAAGSDCVSPGENVGEKFVNLLSAHMADVKVPGTITD
jgi:hypothetical protein